MNEILIGYIIISLVLLVEISMILIKYIKWLRIHGKLISKKALNRIQFLDAIMDETPEKKLYRDFYHYMDKPIEWRKKDENKTSHT